MCRRKSDERLDEGVGGWVRNCEPTCGIAHSDGCASNVAGTEVAGRIPVGLLTQMAVRAMLQGLSW